jgi:flavin reductase (DIM6/NTAB) family NADH-FMN oxidoreductase RutF
VAKADAELFKQSARRFASGVTVVTTQQNDLIYGLTVSAFSTLSIDPLLVLVCIRSGNRLTDMITESGCFAVNILREEQRPVSQYFATPGREPLDAAHGFPDIPTVLDQSGAPIIFGSLAYFDCQVHELHSDGDHTIFIGSVVGAGAMDGVPLVYFDGNYRGVRDREPAAT